MNLIDFKIGQTFFGPANFQWLCTDIGTRSISAIFLDPNKPDIFFQGPPYSVAEVVFDELEMQSCYSNLKDELNVRISSLKNSAHPNFDSTDVFKMIRSKNMDYPNKKLLKHDRVNKNGDILHPYSAEKIDKIWYILTFEIFSREYSKISENDFVSLPFSNESFLQQRKDKFLNSNQNK